MTHIVVIGAGVIGLSTALRIQELGHKVTILAENLPGDKKTIEYTSPWAVSNRLAA
ncbi:D-amino acid oxidase [Ceratobasidium sp. 428]|nr:D-amino acid oxidase [Ceratobasidium sp. 428]